MDRNSGQRVSFECIKSIDVICGDDFSISGPQIKDLNEQIQIHYYDNVATLLVDTYPCELKPVSVPSICIASYGMNMEKLEIQLYLNKYFKNTDYSVGNISFNPIAYLFGFRFLQFPKNGLQYPQCMYEINYDFFEESLKKDIIITSMAGNFKRFVDFRYRLGDTSHIIMNTHSSDIVVLCISNFIEISELVTAINYLKKYIGAKVVLYVSNRSREDTMYASSNYNTRLTEMNVQAYCKEIKALTRTSVFSKENLKNDEMYSHILKLLS